MNNSKDKTMLQQVLRTLLLETADAYRALTEDNVPEALEHLRQVLLHAEGHLKTTNVVPQWEQDRIAKVDAFTVPNRPSGFSSIAGFCLRREIYDWRNSDDDITRDSLIDSRQVMSYMKRSKLQPVKWEAPPALKELGIEAVNIYPENILEAVLSS